MVQGRKMILFLIYCSGFSHIWLSFIYPTLEETYLAPIYQLEGLLIYSFTLYPPSFTLNFTSSSSINQSSSIQWTSNMSTTSFS